jgi:cation-transporting ATPase F
VNSTSQQPWHALEATAIVQHFDVDPARGLHATAVALRREQYGENRLPEQAGKSALQRFAAQFTSPLVIVLLVAAGLTVVVGGIADAGVILGVVLVNAFIGFFQEEKAVDALRALAETVGTECTVRRDGKNVRVAAWELVPGDIVVLEAGDKVPADLRIISCRDAAIAEAALTGESVPVEKQTEPVAADAVVADRTNMAYSSTAVTYGMATGVVVATGASTEVGAISTLLADTVSLATPLTKTIEGFSKILLIAILVLAAVTFGVGMLRGGTVLDMLLAAVALSVGAIPEGLPAAVTIILAIGVNQMAKRRAIIRTLSSVETLGSTTVICSDKTGTLTQNQMTVTEVVTPNYRYQVTGTGYSAEGIISHGGNQAKVGRDVALEMCLRTAVLCSTASVHIDETGQAEVVGDPTEAALLVMASKGGFTRTVEEEMRHKVDEIPFSSEHQYMATLHREDHQSLLLMKGSVEAVVARCTTIVEADGTVSARPLQPVEEAAANLSMQGLRVIAMAMRRLDADVRTLTRDDVSEMVFCGLAAMVDPPRDEAKQAIAACQRAGITVKMITGDHAATASTIAEQLGMTGKRADGRLVAVTGGELATMDAAEFLAVAHDVNVFARTSPEQKLRLVEALQEHKEVVAMTGDGVNDAPALRKADIGVAMGRTGTEVAKDASDMVLTDDNFATIVNAVEEGRTVFSNLLKFIVWTIPTNIGEGLVIVFAIALGLDLPILPVQILWINMTTAVILGLPLAFEPRQPDVMDQPPRNVHEPLIGRDLLMRTLFVGVLLLIFSFALYKVELLRGNSLEAARTAAANGFVIMELFYLFACRTLLAPTRLIGYFSNAYVWGGAALMAVLQIAFTHLPIMNVLFKTAPVDGTSWLIAYGSGLVVLILVSLEKRLRRFMARRAGR